MIDLNEKYHEVDIHSRHNLTWCRVYKAGFGALLVLSQHSGNLCRELSEEVNNRHKQFKSLTGAM